MAVATLNNSRAGFDAEVFEQFLAARDEAAWITDARRAAYATYERLLAKELDPEEFKRVDLRVFNAGRFRPAAAPHDASSVSTLLAEKTEYGGRIIHVDGHTTQADVQDDIVSQGVLFGDLESLLTQNRALLEPYFLNQAVCPDADRFAAWHAAFWTDGTLMYVPRGVEVDLPLHSLIAHRYLNDGFSGGEKKRMEILQLAMLQPKFAILDETDSGLDSDAVRVVSEGLAKLSGPDMGVLIITHHERLLEFNPPQFTHVMLGGRIVESGDATLAHDLHANGYASIRERHPLAAADNAVATAAV